ncbi:Flp pilus assembly protein CpaB [Halodesulfovibrio aestuarii]|uniref:Pilus assembly protein CpaB n=1 Tax=Halodesulfovibrio aestuarii TaxID=126333 RepID=A0A8G2FHA9_9BACT|nr:Flp pilus assembly protein CpaB [Halodesulfovibrio aestuarii]SHI81058.1 pilus assembly protein CpaB [Halodesulfovibrio aestuarii]
MNTRRLVIQLSIAIALAVITGYLTINWMQSLPRGDVTKAPTGETVPVVVAKTTIAPGTVINENMITVKNFLENNKPKSAFGSAEDVSGRVAIYTIHTSEIITDTLLASRDVDVGGVGALIPHGKRAMAVQGNKVLGLSGLIRPGDIVDVLVSFRMKDKSITKVVLENLKVLATGKELVASADGKKSSPIDVYTLEVTPDESEILALAATNGTLHFALRHRSDGETVLTEGADAKKTLSSYRGSKPKNKEEAVTITSDEPQYSIEILRGNIRNTIRVK